MVQPEGVFADLKVLFYRPSASGDLDQRPQRHGLAFGREAQVERQLTDTFLVRDEAAADQQVTAGISGAGPGPAVAAFAFGAGATRVDDPVRGDQCLEHAVGPD